MAQRTIKPVVRKFKEALKKGDFPKAQMYIFGSYARGDARSDSDIDICLVSPAFKQNKIKFKRLATFIAFQVDPRIQVVVTHPQKFWKDPLSPLFSRIRKEAKAA